MKKLLVMFIAIIFLTSIFAGMAVVSATEQDSSLPPIQMTGDIEYAVTNFFSVEHQDIARSAFEHLLNPDLWNGLGPLGASSHAILADLTGDGIYNIISTSSGGSGQIGHMISVFDIPTQRVFRMSSGGIEMFERHHPHVKILDGEFIAYRVYLAGNRIIFGDLVIEDNELIFVRRTAATEQDSPLPVIQVWGGPL